MTENNTQKPEKKLKIGLFIDTYFPMIDGVVMVVHNYATLLSKFADVTVFCPKPKDKNYKDNFDYKVVRCKKIEFGNFAYNVAVPKLDKEFKEILDKTDLDIVHIHSPFALGNIGVHVAKQKNIPVIATLHSQFKQDFKKVVKVKPMVAILMRRIMKVFNACNKCFTVNNQIRELYINDYKLKTPCEIIQNGTELKFLENTQEIANEVNKKYNLEDNTILLHFLGRIVYVKNVFFILDALKILKEKGFKFKMLYIGEGPDLEELQHKISKYALENEVVACGRIEERDDVIKIVNRSNLFLFPSLYDTNSLVQIEAASQKTPTLFLKGAKTATFVTENVNGFFSENDPEKYAEKIIEIFENKDLYDSVCQNCHKDLYITWDQIVETLYQKYLNEIENFKK